MANEIVSAGNGDNTRLGCITVKTGRRNFQQLCRNSVPKAIEDVASKFENRFDDPTYYKNVATAGVDYPIYYGANFGYQNTPVSPPDGDGNFCYGLIWTNNNNTINTPSGWLFTGSAVNGDSRILMYRRLDVTPQDFDPSVTGDNILMQLKFGENFTDVSFNDNSLTAPQIFGLESWNWQLRFANNLSGTLDSLDDYTIEFSNLGGWANGFGIRLVQSESTPAMPELEWSLASGSEDSPCSGSFFISNPLFL